MKKRLLSLVLVFSFIFGTLPVNVLAGTTQTGQSEPKSETRIGNDKVDDIIGPINLDDVNFNFPKGYVAVKFFADDFHKERGEFDGKKKEVVYAVNPTNTKIDMVNKKLNGKTADGKELTVPFPTYSVNDASKATWKINGKAPWKMNPENAIGSDNKIVVKKLGEQQDLIFTAQYEALTIAEIITKENLEPETLKVWVGDTTIPWKKGVKVADKVTDDTLKKKIKGYLDDAKTSYKDNTASARTSQGEAAVKPITGTIRVTFSDNSYIDVEKQDLYVIPHITAATNVKAPADAIEVTFKLGEGVKRGDITGAATAVEYQRYKVKPNTNLDQYKFGTGETIFGNINAQVTDKAKYAGVVW